MNHKTWTCTRDLCWSKRPDRIGGIMFVKSKSVWFRKKNKTVETGALFKRQISQVCVHITSAIGAHSLTPPSCGDADKYVLCTEYVWSPRLTARSIDGEMNCDPAPQSRTHHFDVWRFFFGRPCACQFASLYATYEQHIRIFLNTQTHCTHVTHASR